MALGIFETLDWLKKQDKRLCCRIDQVYDELSAELATKITNQQGTPSFRSDTLANLPAPGQTGRMFISTDTFAFYRDNGIGWDLIGGPGIGTVTGSGTATQVAFWNGSSVISGSSNLYWDNVNGRLGISTASPAYKLDVSGTTRIVSGAASIIADSSQTWNLDLNGYFRIRDGGTNYALLSSGILSFPNGFIVTGQTLYGSNSINSLSTNPLIFTFGNSGGTERARFAGSTGNFLIGSSVDGGEKLQCTGNAAFIIGSTSIRIGTTTFYGQGLSVIGGGGTTQMVHFTNGNASQIMFWRADGLLYNSGTITIGTSTPNASAILQADSTTKGFLPPRMTSAQRTAIASPAVGLIVYQTDATEGLYVNTSTGWRSITMV